MDIWQGPKYTPRLTSKFSLTYKTKKGVILLDITNAIGGLEL